MAFLFLPETSRQVVGNGSVPPRAWNKSGTALVRQIWPSSGPRSSKPPRTSTTATTTTTTRSATVNPLKSLSVFRDKETGLLLVYSGLVYASSYMILSTLPDQLEQLHGLDTLHISLCFLAPGFGAVASVLSTGRLLDWNFRRHARRVGMQISRGTQQDCLAGSFPLERARMESSCAALILGGASMLCYGWTLQAKLPLAIPLVFLFLQSFGSASAFSGLNNLIMDLNRDRPGVASAAMNLTRCWLGAAGTAFASPLVVRSGGTGWLGVLIPGVWLLFSPVVVVVWRCGPRWREGKRDKKEKKARVAEESG